MADKDKLGKVWATPTTPAPEGSSWVTLRYKPFENGPECTGFRLSWDSLDKAREYCGDVAVLAGLNGSNSTRVAIQSIFRRAHNSGTVYTSEQVAEKVLAVYRHARSATVTEVNLGPAPDAEMGEDMKPTKLAKYASPDAAANAWREFYTR